MAMPNGLFVSLAWLSAYTLAYKRQLTDASFYLPKRSYHNAKYKRITRRSRQHSATCSIVKPPQKAFVNPVVDAVIR